MVVLAAALLAPQASWAHCDTMNGPVVTDAEVALETGDVTPVLKWVRTADEPEIREAFQRTLAVREKGDEARALAEQFFLETLVRVHRVSEGASYTGLKPAGTEVGAAIELADEALGTGSEEALVELVSQKAADGVRERFAKALEAKRQADDSVEAGREFVAAYVEFVHYARAVHEAAEHDKAHHHTDAVTDAHADHHDDAAPCNRQEITQGPEH